MCGDRIRMEWMGSRIMASYESVRASQPQRLADTVPLPTPTQAAKTEQQLTHSRWSYRVASTPPAKTWTKLLRVCIAKQPPQPLLQLLQVG